jgi:hypothetical protein
VVVVGAGGESKVKGMNTKERNGNGVFSLSFMHTRALTRAIGRERYRGKTRGM